jgi:hypothetical protein
MEPIQQLAGTIHSNHDLIHLDRRHVSKPPCDLKAGFDFGVRTNGNTHVIGECRGSTAACTFGDVRWHRDGGPA